MQRDFTPLGSGSSENFEECDLPVQPTIAGDPMDLENSNNADRDGGKVGENGNGDGVDKKDGKVSFLGRLRGGKDRSKEVQSKA